ncbi:MAG: fibronectin type III domain-containing protein [Ignavibacteriae bacterium]|nr:fibronectin type III domain-containing protein [Ignavibacteriota bacterium]
MANSKVKLGLHRLSVPEKLTFTETILKSMTGNASFPDPQPPLAEIEDAAKFLKEAQADQEASYQIAQSKTSIRDDKEKILNDKLTSLAGYVERTSAGDDAIILSAGMEVKAAPSRLSALTIATNLSATMGDGEGEIDLSWDPVTGAKSYVIEMSLDPPTATSWSQVAVSTNSSKTVANLKSGTKYWFRVAAIGGNNLQGSASDPATKVAP